MKALRIESPFMYIIKVYLGDGEKQTSPELTFAQACKHVKRLTKQKDVFMVSQKMQNANDSVEVDTKHFL